MCILCLNKRMVHVKPASLRKIDQYHCTKNQSNTIEFCHFDSHHFPPFHVRSLFIVRGRLVECNILRSIARNVTSLEQRCFLRMRPFFKMFPFTVGNAFDFESITFKRLNKYQKQYSVRVVKVFPLAYVGYVMFTKQWIMKIFHFFSRAFGFVPLDVTPKPKSH